jgi:hypothetical protein
MKFQAQWFMDGKEVDLPDMKVEGSLAVAELTKKHADEFVPFVLAVQEDATLRARAMELSRFLLSKTDADEDTIRAAKLVLKLYKKPADDNINTLIEQAQSLFDELSTKMNENAEKIALVSLQSAPFFMKRSILEAYYMMKAYIWTKARSEGRKPNMPFTHEELQSHLCDADLALFSKYSMDKIKESASEQKEEMSVEEIKKKSSPNPET